MFKGIHQRTLSTTSIVLQRVEASSPHPVSQIRLVRFKGQSESKEMAEYNRLRQDIQLMHHSFWEHNNTHFANAKAQFEDNVITLTGNPPTPADFSRFYKSYLQSNQSRHMEYNKRWWKANSELLTPALRAEVGALDIGAAAVGVAKGLKTFAFVLIGMDPQVRRNAQGVSVR